MILEGFNAGVTSEYTTGEDGNPVDRESGVGGYSLPDVVSRHTARKDDTGGQDQQDRLLRLRQQQQQHHQHHQQQQSQQQLQQYRQQCHPPMLPSPDRQHYHPPMLPPANYLQAHERGTQAEQTLSQQERATRPPPPPPPPSQLSEDVAPNMPTAGAGGCGGRRGPGGGVGKTQLSSSTLLPHSQPQQRQESISGSSSSVSSSVRGHLQGMPMAGAGPQNQEGAALGAYGEDMLG